MGADDAVPGWSIPHFWTVLKYNAVYCNLNLKKEGGWDEYKKQTEKKATRIVDMVENSKTVEDNMKEIEAVNDKVKFASFGKTRKTNAKKKPDKDKKVC